MFPGITLPLWLLVALFSACAESTITEWRFPGLLDATLEDLQQGLTRGCFNSSDLVRAYQERIRQVNDRVHAVSEMNPDALAIAASLDERRRTANSTSLGPLYGLPILLKDNVATMDKMNNTAGSTLLRGAKVPHDSTIARKLREAGAILLGKANMDEWADFRSKTPPIGWSAHGGQTTAAWYPDANPDGSSCGSGVAADLGLAFAAIGTDTGGSITHPAAMNNVVGIKPTVGLTSRHLVVPVSEHRDTVGPMARTVRDAARLLQAIVGPDPADNYTSAIPFARAPDYAAACRESSLQGARIGVPRGYFDGFQGWKESFPQEAFDKALRTMEEAGATVVPVSFTWETRLGNFSDIQHDDYTSIRADMVAGIADYFAKLVVNPQNIRTLADLRERTRNASGEAFPTLDTSFWDAALDLDFDNSDPRAWAAYQNLLRLQGPDGLLGALQRHNVTAVVMPSRMAPQLAHGIGTPIVTVPLGHYPDTTPIELETNIFNTTLVVKAPAAPVGLSFLGRHWSESDLIGLAYGFEQRTRVRGRARHVVVPKAEVAVSASCYA